MQHISPVDKEERGTGIQFRLQWNPRTASNNTRSRNTADASATLNNKTVWSQTEIKYSINYFVFPPIVLKILCLSIRIPNCQAMFVMLSVRTTSVCERHAKSTAKEALTTLDNLLINKSSIEKLFTKSVSFDKNINQTNLILTQPNNLKEPPAQQVNTISPFILFSLPSLNRFLRSVRSHLVDVLQSNQVILKLYSMLCERRCWTMSDGDGNRNVIGISCDNTERFESDSRSKQST